MTTTTPRAPAPETEAPRRRLTGAQIIAESLIARGIPYAVGIPGHGSWSVVDAIRDYEPRLKLLPVLHEQSAVHLADGYYRASGRPLFCFTSIGPGACNTVVGMGTAYVDSTAVLLMTGSVHTHMRGHAVLQELERRHDADFPRVLEPVVKRWWQPSRVDELPSVLDRAFVEMLTGRPGPVLLDVPMDVQADAAEVRLPRQIGLPGGRPRPDATLVERAADLLAGARRPVIVAGGGVISADAADLLTRVARLLGAPVVTTWMGKGAIPEDDPLFGGAIGDTASTSGNRLAATADVLLAVGCRFTDWSASSYRRGVTFSIPPSKLVQIDIDPHELGKNYPVEVGIVADAQAALADLLVALGDRRPSGPDPAYRDEIARLKAEWARLRDAKRFSTAVPMTQQRAVYEIRSAADRGAIVTSGAGLVQAIVRQDWEVYEPRTHLTSGGFSTMGFTVPAALGAKLARPDRQVIAMAGDGDFLQTMQEVALAAMWDLPVLFVVLNNAGWISIKGGQLNTFGRPTIVDFLRPDGSVYSPDFAAVGRAFGLEAVRVEDPDQLRATTARLLASGAPALLEVIVAREFPDAGLIKTGWWDVPVHEGRAEARRAYEQGRAEEQHL